MKSRNLKTVKSALRVLPDFEDSDFEQWFHQIYVEEQGQNNFDCAIVDYNLDRDRVVALPAAIAPIYAAVNEHLQSAAEDPWGLLDDKFVILKLSDQSGGRSGRLLLFSFHCISRTLKKLFPLEKITPGEQNTLLQTLAGLTLKQAAEKDFVSYDTKKSQLKSVFHKTQIRSQQALSSFLITHLSLELTANYSRQPTNVETDEMFFSYVDQFMGNYVRASVVQESKAHRFRLIEIGDPSGHPVVCIHHLGLISFSAEEVVEIYNRGIRLICPLRYGALGPSDRIISAQQHFEHAISGIDLAVSVFGGEKATIIGLLSGCFYAINYLKQYPDKVGRLILFGASYKPQLEQESNSHFKKNLHKIATDNETTLDATVSFLLSKVDQPEQLRKVMEESHNNCEEDFQVIHELFSDQKQVLAMQHRLRHSSMSIVQDLRMQSIADWQPLLGSDREVNVHFIHGTADKLNSIDSLAKLIDQRNNYHLHPVEGAGNWLFGRYTQQTFSIVRSILDDEG